YRRTLRDDPAMGCHRPPELAVLLDDRRAARLNAAPQPVSFVAAAHGARDRFAQLRRPAHAELNPVGDEEDLNPASRHVDFTRPGQDVADGVAEGVVASGDVDRSARWHSFLS